MRRGERPRERAARQMTVSPARVRGIAERACARPDIPGARPGRESGAVISALTGAGGPWTS